MTLKTKFTSYIQSNYGYISFSVLGILSIPFSLYVFNAQEFGYDIVLVAIPGIIVASIILAGFLVTLLGGLVYKKFSKFNRILQNTLSAIGLIIFVNDFFAPTKAGALDGTVADIPEPIVLTIIEFIFVLIIMLLLIVSFKNIKITKIFVTISKYALALFAFFCFTLIYIQGFVSDQHRKQDPDFTEWSSESNQPIKKLPNIYLIWLDGMQNDFMVKGLKEKNLFDEFSGFTLFKNNTSNYLYSLQSSQSFLNGTLFKGGDYKAWGKKDTLRKILKKNNYRLSSYTMSNFVSPIDDVSFKLQDIFKEGMSIKHPFVVDFIQYWLLRSAPNYLANESFDHAGRISEKIDSLINRNRNEHNIKTIDDGILPYTAPITVSKAISDESLRNSNNEFVMLHNIIPHAPYVMDASCQFIGKSNNSLKSHERYYHQSLCATKLASQFLNKLKEMNRYDESVIVILSDHGAGWTHLYNDEKNRHLKPLNPDYSHWYKDQVLMRSSALLMIKKANSDPDIPLFISNKLTQHIDLTPTLVSLLRLDPNNEYKFDGNDIFSQLTVNKDKIITYYKPTTYPDFDDAEIYKVITNENNELTDLEFAGKFNAYFSKKGGD